MVDKHKSLRAIDPLPLPIKPGDGEARPVSVRQHAAIAIESNKARAHPQPNVYFDQK